MTLEQLVEMARQAGASDLHLEPGYPAVLRVRGELKRRGEPLRGAELRSLVRGVLGDALWAEFRARGSSDLARTVSGVRCRINAMHSQRGVGLAIRLLPARSPTLTSLNLHPDLARLVRRPHGLILVSGATGSGKSSTLAALLQEINRSQARHILTIEQPIEVALRPQRAFIRQRAVGRDTPTFAQALLDALREDPDVIMVGEMRDPETMRLTLNAAETGHLVLATLHSSNCAEAVQRLIMAFAPEVQASVACQLADCLVGVLAQRLVYRPDLQMQVPECELLLASSATRAIIRGRELHKLASVLETGGAAGMYSWDRYRRWLDSRRTWSRPGSEPASDHADEPTWEEPQRDPAFERLAVPASAARAAGLPAAGPSSDNLAASSAPAPGAEPRGPGVLVIDEPGADVASILRELQGRGGSE